MLPVFENKEFGWSPTSYIISILDLLRDWTTSQQLTDTRSLFTRYLSTSLLNQLLRSRTTSYLSNTLVGLIWHPHGYFGGSCGARATPLSAS